MFNFEVLSKLGVLRFKIEQTVLVEACNLEEKVLPIYLFERGTPFLSEDIKAKGVNDK